MGVGTPKPIGDLLDKVPGGDFSGNKDFVFISGGLEQAATAGFEIDALNGLLFNTEVKGSIPLSVSELTEKPKLELNSEILKTGLNIVVSPLQSELGYHVFDDTFYTNIRAGISTGFSTGVNVGAESKLEIATDNAEFKLLGLQIFKIPDLLGEALIAAIADIFG